VRFSPGQQVRVSDRPHEGHHRTPGYIKGKVGAVERAQGEFTDPETRAYSNDGLPKRPLYLVGFEQREVWPGYERRDRISLDVYEHWLEAVE
jgi:nitrile hydratase beta subunit-like protein